MAATVQNAFKAKITPGEDHGRYKGASGSGKLRQVDKKIFLIDSHKTRKNWNLHFISLPQKTDINKKQFVWKFKLKWQLNNKTEKTLKEYAQERLLTSIQEIMKKKRGIERY